MLKILALLLLAAVILGQLFVRLYPLDPKAYHVDLRSLEQHGQGASLRDPTGNFQSFALGIRSDALERSISNIITSTPRTTLLAETVAKGQVVSSVTYVTRSAFWGFPDVTTVEIEQTNMGAALRIYGRLVFGKADFGMNKTRINTWLDQLFAQPLKDHLGDPIPRPPSL
ncbi:DUF1499 domain-containing protein [uncultured Litoreibacter sp.]|uniref:DUF1499 domain-containing protein n=1 Tax=uncultured Litoreibacter sp. TaxID=1392394 RepID=UPI0026220491|nr:DUF1499 domain-containing protein [uncultured Litoreibacter sp.]